MDEKEFYALSERVARLEEYKTGAEKALVLADSALKLIQAAANEWRGTVQDIINKCLTRTEAESLLREISLRVTHLEKTGNTSEGKSSGFHASWAIAISLLGIGLIILGLTLRKN